MFALGKVAVLVVPVAMLAALRISSFVLSELFLTNAALSANGGDPPANKSVVVLPCLKLRFVPFHQKSPSLDEDGFTPDVIFIDATAVVAAANLVVIPVGLMKSPVLFTENLTFAPAKLSNVRVFADNVSYRLPPI